MTCGATLAAALGLSLSSAVHADRIIAPPVPSNIQVPAGSKAFRVGHAIGTQNYVCLPSGASFKFTLFTPQATLFSDDDKEIITHYFSPNPHEAGTIRATWQHARDTSTVWGQVRLGESSTDPLFVAPGAIAWLLIRVVGNADGPTGGDTLSATTVIQRLNSSGGVAPSVGCTSAADVGNQAFVPYTADYFFYK